MTRAVLVVSVVVGTVAVAGAIGWALGSGTDVAAEPTLNCDLADHPRGVLLRGDTFSVPGATVSRSSVVIGCGTTALYGLPWELGVFWIKGDGGREASCTYSSFDGVTSIDCSDLDIGPEKPIDHIDSSTVDDRTTFLVGTATSKAASVTLHYRRSDGTEDQSDAVVTPVRRSAQRKVRATGPFVVWLLEAPADAKLIALEARDRHGKVIHRTKPGGHVIS